MTTARRTKLVKGVGVYEEGKYVATVRTPTGTYRPTKEYNTWAAMLHRCYDAAYKQKCKTYKDAAADPRFHNFQDFCLWAEEQVGAFEHGFCLDKDFLVRNNKLYSPETCVFVPHEVNQLLTKSNATRGQYPLGVTYDEKYRNKFLAQVWVGARQKKIGRFSTPEEAFQAYKEEKEAYIKVVAERWKGRIDDKVYDAMYAYSVDIND